MKNKTNIPLCLRNKSATRKKIWLASALGCALAIAWTGCTTQQQQQRQKAQPTNWSATEPAPAPEPAAAAKVSCADPTWGLIRMTKAMPAEATLNGEFTASLSLTAQGCAANVVVRDIVPDGATYVRSEPAATVDGNQLVWNIGEMDAGQTINAKIWLKATKEGILVNCATVSADPRVCAETRIVNPAIQLTKTEPNEVCICDPIPVTLVVKNIGSSKLTTVKVTDTLPSGLTSVNNASLVFDAGSLAPGESKEFKFDAKASSPGKYVNTADVTSDQGVNAKATASTVVHQPVLAITCQAREQQFIGRTFDVALTVANTGDTDTTGTQVIVPVPSGLTFKSATAGGHASGDNLVWDLGALPMKASKELGMTFTSASAGTFTFNATAKDTCAEQASTSCETRIVGVSALLLEKADNPDPIELGETTTYTVKVTNQGTADDTNIKVVVKFPAEIDPVNASNGGVVDGKTVTFPAYPRLAPKQAFEYSMVGKGVKVGDARVTFIRTSDGIPNETTAEESTRVY